MDNVIAVAVIEGIGKGFYNLTNLAFCFASMHIFGIVELAPLHALHDYVEVIEVVVDFINLNYIRVLQLNYLLSYAKHDFALVLVYT